MGAIGHGDVCLLKFEADQRTFMIAINSIGTYLSADERLTLCPRLGRLYPHGQALLAKATDYEQIRAVSEHFNVSVASAEFDGSWT